MATRKRVTVYTDGAARNNPGPASSAWIIKDSKGKTLTQGSTYLGETTNNVAEYQAVIEGLRSAKRFSPSEIEVMSDSLLVVKQVNGTWKVKKPHLAELHKQVLKATRGVTCSFTWVPRATMGIMAADAMCNEVLDREAPWTVEAVR